MSSESTAATGRLFNRSLAGARGNYYGAGTRQAGTASNYLLLNAPVYEASIALSSEERAMFLTIRQLPVKQRAKLIVILEDLHAEAEHECAVRDAPRQAARSLARAWDNPEDARYNDL